MRITLVLIKRRSNQANQQTVYNILTVLNAT